MGKKRYSVIIDTNEYSGNFEREMCAYITGVLGECGVGKEQAQIYFKETGKEPMASVVLVSDEHGYHRPVCICATPGWFNNGYGFYYKVGQEKEALENFKSETREHFPKGVAKAEKRKTPPKYDAYQSVEIFFQNKPSQNKIIFIKRRAYCFAEYLRNSDDEFLKRDITIIGFRLKTKGIKNSFVAV